MSQFQDDASRDNGSSLGSLSADRQRAREAPFEGPPLVAPLQLKEIEEQRRMHLPPKST